MSSLMITDEQRARSGRLFNQGPPTGGGGGGPKACVLIAGQHHEIIPFERLTERGAVRRASAEFATTWP